MAQWTHLGRLWLPGYSQISGEDKASPKDSGGVEPQEMKGLPQTSGSGRSSICDLLSLTQVLPSGQRLTVSWSLYFREGEKGLM